MGHESGPASPWSGINSRLPIIPHGTLGTGCCGCLIVKVCGDQADIVCNECAAVICTFPFGAVEAAILEMAQTDTFTARAVHVAKPSTLFPGFSTIEAFICSECGEGVPVITPIIVKGVGRPNRLRERAAFSIPAPCASYNP